MIAWMFFVILAVGIVLMALGFIIDIPVITFVGTTMIFLLGLNLLSAGLDYKSGVEDVYVYGNNFSGYHWDYDGTQPPPKDLDAAYLFHTNSTDIYSHYDDAGADRFGWFLLVLGALAFVMGLFRL